MNRDKFVNDESYREGYLDGRKEGTNAIVTAFMPCFDKIEEEIKYLKQNGNEMCNEIELEQR